MHGGQEHNRHNSKPQVSNDHIFSQAAHSQYKLSFLSLAIYGSSVVFAYRRHMSQQLTSDLLSMLHELHGRRAAAAAGLPYLAAAPIEMGFAPDIRSDSSEFDEAAAREPAAAPLAICDQPPPPLHGTRAAVVVVPGRRIPPPPPPRGSPRSAHLAAGLPWPVPEYLRGDAEATTAWYREAHAFAELVGAASATAMSAEDPPVAAAAELPAASSPGSSYPSWEADGWTRDADQDLHDMQEAGMSSEEWYAGHREMWGADPPPLHGNRAAVEEPGSQQEPEREPEVQPMRSPPLCRPPPPPPPLHGNRAAEDDSSDEDSYRDMSWYIPEYFLTVQVDMGHGLQPCRLPLGPRMFNPVRPGFTVIYCDSDGNLLPRPAGAPVLNYIMADDSDDGDDEPLTTVETYEVKV